MTGTSDEEWLPARSAAKADEPITHEDWLARERKREGVAARLALIARGIMPGPDPVMQLAEIEVIDIVTGRGTIDDGRCPDFED